MSKREKHRKCRKCDDCDSSSRPLRLCGTTLAQLNAPIMTTQYTAVLQTAVNNIPVGTEFKLTSPYPVPLTDFKDISPALDIFNNDVPSMPTVKYIQVEAVSHCRIMVGGTLTKTVQFVPEISEAPVTFEIPFQIIIENECIRACENYRVVNDSKMITVSPVYTCAEFKREPFTGITQLYFNEKDMINVCVEKIIMCPTKDTPVIDSITPALIILPTANIIGDFTYTIPAGTTVVIRGQNLYPINSVGVMFGDFCGHIIQSCPPNIIIAELPPLPIVISADTPGNSVSVTLDVIVDNGCGKMAVKSDAITVRLPFTRTIT